MKKCLGLALFFLANTVSFAGDAGSPVKNDPHGTFNGPYIGAGLGYTHQYADYEYRQVNFTFNNLYFSNKYDASQDNTSYHGIAGYGLTLYPFYLGSELSIGTINGETRALPLKSGGISLVKEQQKKNLSASFLFGALVTDSTLLYGQAGIGAAEYELSIQDFNSNVVPRRQSQSNWTSQYVLGGGVEQVVWKNLSLRLAYLYEKGQRIIGPSASTVDFANNRLDNQHEQTYVPSNHSVMLDVIWRLNLV
jgi:opacity protein-like surface antigen